MFGLARLAPGVFARKPHGRSASLGLAATGLWPMEALGIEGEGEVRRQGRDICPLWALCLRVHDDALRSGRRAWPAQDAIRRSLFQVRPLPRTHVGNPAEEHDPLRLCAAPWVLVLDLAPLPRPCDPIEVGGKDILAPVDACQVVCNRVHVIHLVGHIREVLGSDPADSVAEVGLGVSLVLGAGAVSPAVGVVRGEKDAVDLLAEHAIDGRLVGQHLLGGEVWSVVAEEVDFGELVEVATWPQV